MKMYHLAELDLSGNFRMSTESLNQVLLELSVSYVLHTLRLARMQMRDVGPALDGLRLGHLTTLDLSMNKLRSLASTDYEQFGSLRELILDNNRLR